MPNPRSFLHTRLVDSAAQCGPTASERQSPPSHQEASGEEQDYYSGEIGKFAGHLNIDGLVGAPGFYPGGAWPERPSERFGRSILNADQAMGR